jgi:hypothetical protein
VAHPEKEAKSWRADPEATSASGGHLPPEVDTAGPLFDPLFDPIPAPPDAEARRREWVAAGDPASDVTQPTPYPGAPDTERPMPPGRKVGRTPRPTVRRVRRTLKRVSPLTVFKLSLFYYSLFLLVWLVVVAVAYWFLESTRFFEALEEVSDIFKLWNNVELTLGLFERYALFFGLIMVLLGSLINAFLAFLYNLGSDLFGGVEMTFVERDL